MYFMYDCLEMLITFGVPFETNVKGVRPFDIAMKYPKLLSLFEYRLTEKLENYSILASKHNLKDVHSLLLRCGMKESQM